MASNKKLEAKKAMLQKLSKSMNDDMKKGVGEGLKSKKMEKVTVMAPNKEGLEKGLSTAQKLLAAKFGDKFDSEEEEGEEAEYEECPHCGGEGCPICEGDEE